MNCRETREYLFAFLDDELDAALSLDVQRHLERCPDCARDAELEREIRRGLSRAIEAVAPPSPVDVERIFRPSRLRRAARVAALALALAGAIAAGVHWGGSQPQLSTALLVADFEHFLASGRPLHLASGDAASVTSWIRGETTWQVELPTMHGRCKLMGARRCNIAGRTAALACYDMEGQPAALLVMPGERALLQEMADLDGRRRVDRREGHTIVACQHGNLTYAAVGRLPERQLIELMPGE